MTAVVDTLADDIELEGHGRGWDGDDLAGTPVSLVFVQWWECEERYGARSPAALGCLLALVRLAWGLPHASAVRIVTAAGSRITSFPFPEDGAERTPSGGWVRYKWCVRAGQVHDKRELAGNSHATDADALLAALRAAPVAP